MLSIIYQYVLFLGLLLALLYHILPKKEAPQTYHFVITALLAVVLIVETYGYTLNVKGQYNLWVYNLFNPLLMGGFLLYFYLILHGSLVKKFVISAIILVISVGLISNLFIDIQTSFNASSFLLGYAACLIFAVYFFYEIFAEESLIELHLLNYTPFWITSFILFYFAWSLIYFISVNYLFTLSMEVALRLFLINQIMGMTLYLAIGLSFHAPWLKKPRKRDKDLGLGLPKDIFKSEEDQKA